MLKDIAPKARPRTTATARHLRRKMSLPEVILWQVLRRHPGGLKFRRQHPSGQYVFDFFCSDACLAIEIDSEAHSRGDRPQRDELRDASFENAGIKTLRIAATDVLRDADAVVRWIIVEAQARLPLHHPAAPSGPPPRDELGKD